MADRDLTGRILGDFVLLEQIGEGGWAAVYRGEQTLLKRYVVVKVLHPRQQSDDVGRARFLREAQLASQLDHPYAAHVYAFGIAEEDGILWIAMELVLDQAITRPRNCIRGAIGSRAHEGLLRVRPDSFPHRVLM
jgi:serine/threonine protein kinase